MKTAIRAVLFVLLAMAATTATAGTVFTHGTGFGSTYDAALDSAAYQAIGECEHSKGGEPVALTVVRKVQWSTGWEVGVSVQCEVPDVPPPPMSDCPPPSGGGDTGDGGTTTGPGTGGPGTSEP